MPTRLSPTASIWIDPEPIPASFVLADLHPNPLLARLLYRRGLRDAASARAFIDRRPQPSPNPYALPNMREAVTRVGKAIAGREWIGIFGDYDVDGVTATALLARALRAAVEEEYVETFVPTRAHGYGLNREGIDILAETGSTLMIAVDCGSNDHDQVAYARSVGMDVVILDHHRIAHGAPNGAVTVSPQLGGDAAYRDLTGAGVAYLLISALAQEGYEVNEHHGHETGFLDLVALGTVADVAPLDGINRSLVRDGLAELAHNRRPGLVALLERARLDPARVTTTDISFSIAPRLNAAGRMDSPELALELLLSEDPGESVFLADRLEGVNVRRRSQTDELLSDAHAQIARIPDWQSQPVIALSSPTWPGGLLGAAASRLQDDLRRPVLLFRQDGDHLHGSGRSIPGFDLVTALDNAGHCLTRFGGHSQAAGIALEVDQLETLRDSLSAQIIAQSLEIPAPPIIVIDDELADGEVDPKTVRTIAELEPIGSGNPAPIFRISGAQVLRYTTMGKDQTHLRMHLQAGRRQFTGVLFGAAHRSRELVANRTIDVIGSLEINTWNGRESLQMMLKDFRIA